MGVLWLAVNYVNYVSTYLILIHVLRQYFVKTVLLFPEGNTIVEAEDEVFFLAAANDIRSVISELRRMDKPIERVMIAGGGNIGRRLANALDKAQEKKIPG